MDFTGITELITTILEGIANFDMKTINFDYLGELLDLVAPIWNPIWTAINEWHYAFLGL